MIYQSIPTNFGKDDKDNKISDTYLNVNGGELKGDITFDKGSTYSIGSTDKKLKELWADEVHISQNTLYVGDVPVIGSSAETIVVKADKDQSLQMKTSGEGISQVVSESGINLSSVGANSTINVSSKGSNSSVNVSADKSINLTASEISINGTTTVRDLNVVGTTTFVNAEDLKVKDNVIEINSEENGNGVTKGTAGIKVNRGDALPYLIEFDESDDLFKVGEQGDLEVIASRNYVDNEISTHNHDGRYYTETEVNNLLKGKSDTTHGHSYNDLTDKPTIPTVNNATLTIQKNGTKVQSFTANASSNVTCNITVPTKTSDLTNDSNFLTEHQDVSSFETKANAITSLSVNGKTVTITKGDGSTSTITTQDTDTHWTTTMYVGAKDSKSNAVTTNGNAYLKLYDNNTVRSQLNIKGSGATTVTTDANGVITISSTDNNTTYSAGSNITLSGTTFSLTKDNVTSALGYTPPTTNTTYSVATTSKNGLMSSTDKTKLDGLSNYSLPTGAKDVLGGVKTTSTVTSTSGLTACPIISGVVYYKDTDTNTDTKVTNTLANTTKAYITATTSATTNTGTQVFDSNVYLTTTSGQLHADIDFPITEDEIKAIFS